MLNLTKRNEQNFDLSIHFGITMPSLTRKKVLSADISAIVARLFGENSFRN